jgi:hypothetical protein
MKFSFYLWPEVFEVFSGRSCEERLKCFPLSFITNPLLVGLELGWKMTLIPFGVSLVTEPFVIVIIPFAESFNTDKLEIWELIPYHPCCWKEIRCAVDPRYPELLFSVMLESTEQVIGHEYRWIAILDGKRPAIPVYEVLLTLQ